MPYTNFNNGITSFGVPIFGAFPNGQPPTNGVLFVDTVNGVNAGTGNGPTYPYQTLAYALTQAAANSTIYVMPGSAIAVSSATALAVSVAGVQIIGLGNGNARPTITLNTANTATIAVSAANVSFQNFIFIANFLSIATCFTLTTAKGFTLIGCSFRETSNVLNFLNIVTSTGAANTVDNLTAIGNQWNGLGTTSVNSFILSANDIDGAVCVGNTVILARTATAAILATITAGIVTNFYAEVNSLYSKQTAETGGAIINVGGSTSTGLLINNRVADLASASDILYTVTSGLQGFNNTKTGALAAQGFPVPAIDT